jgi:hypothetical protein
LLSEKPHANKNQFSLNPEETQREMGELKAKLDTLSAVPKKKYPFPLTSSHEIGWDHQEVKYTNMLICVWV